MEVLTGRLLSATERSARAEHRDETVRGADEMLACIDALLSELNEQKGTLVCPGRHQ